jgi:predicted nucleotidyltransferase
MTRKDEIKNSIRKVLKSYFQDQPFFAFIFGSQANSKQLMHADIDIGLENVEISPKELFLLKLELEDLDILYPIDLVDFEHCSEEFKNIARQNIEPL